MTTMAIIGRHHRQGQGQGQGAGPAAPPRRLRSHLSPPRSPGTCVRGVGRLAWQRQRRQRRRPAVHAIRSAAPMPPAPGQAAAGNATAWLLPRPPLTRNRCIPPPPPSRCLCWRRSPASHVHVCLCLCSPPQQQQEVLGAHWGLAVPSPDRAAAAGAARAAGAGAPSIVGSGEEMRRNRAALLGAPSACFCLSACHPPFPPPRAAPPALPAMLGARVHC
jgi:hypothetical protein